MSLPRHTHERACAACGGTSHVPFADERIDPGKATNYTYASRKQPELMCLRLVKCTNCDLIYAPSPPSADFLLNAYSKSAYDSYTEAQAAARSYSHALAPYLLRLAGRNAAVDVGAGSGTLLPWLRDNGFDPVIGIEPSRSAIEAAPRAVQSMLWEGMFSPALLAGIRPSLLCSFMTLEHLAEPGEFVSSAYELLEPGGMLALVVHDWRAPVNRLLGMRSPIIDVEHLQLFCPKALRMMLTRAGFEVLDLKSISNSYSLRYWLRLMPMPSAIKSGMQNFFARIGLDMMEVSMRVGNKLAIGVKPASGKE